MNFETSISGKIKLINIKEENGHYVVTIDDGKPIHADLIKTNREYNLLINGRSFRVALATSNKKFEIQLDGNLFELELVSDLQKARRKLHGEELTGAGTIVAKMPGKIIKILAKVGDEVHDGQSIIIMEAMKMENELKSLAKGTIKEIRVKEGDSVDAGTLLVIME